MACETYFRSALKERGLRVTKQRELVLATLHEAAQPETAEQIYREVSALDPGVDLSTVYRTLALLQELRLVSGVESADGESRFELVSIHGPHLHLLCQSCGRVEGVAPSEAREFVDKMRSAFGFEVQVEQMVVPGLCQDCRARGEVSRPPWVKVAE